MTTKQKATPRTPSEFMRDFNRELAAVIGLKPLTPEEIEERRKKEEERKRQRLLDDRAWIIKEGAAFLDVYLGTEVEVRDGVRLTLKRDAVRGPLDAIFRRASRGLKRSLIPADGGGVILNTLKTFKNAKVLVANICRSARVSVTCTGPGFTGRTFTLRGGVTINMMMNAYSRGMGGDVDPVEMRSVAKALARWHLVRLGIKIKPSLKLMTNGILEDFAGPCSLGASSPRRCAKLDVGPCGPCAFLLRSRKICVDPSPQLDMFKGENT